MPIWDGLMAKFRKRDLKAELGEPGTTSIRSAWSNDMASGLTPQGLADILRRSAEGDIEDYLSLAEQMEERDPHYMSVLGTRKRAVSAVDAIVEAASDDPKDEEIAEEVREMIAGHDGFSDLVEDMLDALGKGFSITEIIWDSDGKSWWPREFRHRDPRWFVVDRYNGREFRLRSESNPSDGDDLQPFKWICHNAKLKSGLPIRGGLARVAAFSWMCKAYTMKDWIAFVETYGLPIRLGRYNANATKEDVETLFRAVANIGTDAAAVLPESMKIDFQEISAGQGNTIFEDFARWADEQVSKAVLGQTMTSDDGSSQAQANVHNDVRYDLAAADGKSVTVTLNRDLVIPYVFLNHGAQERYPRLKLEVREAEDVDKILANTFRMVSLGLAVKATEVRQRLGYSEPDDDDEVIGGPKTETETAPPAQNRSRNRSSGSDDPFIEMDAIELEALEDWEAVMGDVVGPILELLQTATDYDEAQDIIRSAFPNMDTSLMIDGLVKASFKARANGDVS